MILDLHMPEMDGYALLGIMHSDNELRRIPVILLTSEKDAEVKCLQMGAADFITKPYDVPDVIRARVQRSIELAEDSVIIHQTERDELTGIFNKEFFFEYGKRLDIQNDHMPMDAVFIDINRFHIINELYGRSYGDGVLKKIGNYIHSIVQDMGGLACRFESNSFCLYIPHILDLNDRVELHIKKFHEILNNRNISLRIGVYADNGSEMNIDQRFECARRACQKLRNHYTTGFSIYNDELHDKELYAERLIKDMDKALAEKQFRVFYQPKYNVTGDVPKLSSSEALISWVHPDFGMVSPEEFISLFEDNGLIQKLDHYVWNEAAAQINRWKKKLGVSLPVSVNVSRVDLFDQMLGDNLEEIVKKNGLAHGELLLEITESVYSGNSHQLIDTVNGLRERGFIIEMDDFGSGYSSLNMLTDLPIDALKLDMKLSGICAAIRRIFVWWGS